MARRFSRQNWIKNLHGLGAFCNNFKINGLKQSFETVNTYGQNFVNVKRTQIENRQPELFQTTRVRAYKTQIYMLLYSAWKINIAASVCLDDLLLAACGKIGLQNEYSDGGKSSKDMFFQKGKKRSIINRSHRYKKDCLTMI